MSTDAVLVQVPWAKACEPTPGLLALAASLRATGARVEVVDANLEVQEALFSADRLGREAAARAAADGPPARLTSARRAARHAPEALGALRDPATYASYRPYRAALDTLAEACRALTRPGKARLSLSDVSVEGLSPLSTRDLLAAAEDPSPLPFAAELRAVVPRVLAGSPRLVGVSAVYLSQALAAFALAGMLRREGFDGRLVLGGGVSSSWAPRLGPDSPLFRVWDALVAGPGEAALAALLSGRGLAEAPGLLAPELGIWRPPEVGARPSVCFAPDAAGLPWGRYLSPGPVLPLASSRGCYWARCAFCPEAADGRQGFRMAGAEELRRTVLDARDRQGVRWLHLTDDAVPPAALRGLARGLRGEGVSWYGFARLEPALLEPGFAEELAAAGCAMLQLGVETASQRLLDRLGKGTRLPDVRRALRRLADAGIRTYVYLLFGVPGETADEARATADWAEEHADSITFLNLSLMNLPRGSALEREGGRYGVTSLTSLSPGNDLSLYWAYQSEGAGGRRELRRLLAETRARPAIARILARTPPGFTSNHAAFAPLPSP